MNATPITADYVGTLRHACPACGRPAAIRSFAVRDHFTVYCEWLDCEWERVTVMADISTADLVRVFADDRVADALATEDRGSVAHRWHCAVVNELRHRGLPLA